MKKFIFFVMVLFATTVGLSADKKITDLPALTAGSFATLDLIPIVDMSAGLNKKTTIGDFDTRYLAITTTTQSPNFVYSGPISGVNAAPTFRLLDPLDIPDLAATKITYSGGGTVNAALLDLYSPAVINFTEQGSTPATPSAGFKKLYAKTNGKVYTVNSSGVEKQVGSGAGGSGGVNILAEYNPEFEDGLANWTESGGTEAAAASTNILFDLAGTTWDSSGAGQTYCSDLVAIPQGLKGTNGEAYLWTQVPSGTATHTLQVSDGSNTLVSTSIVSTATPAKQRVNFAIPTSGSVKLCLVAVAADEPLVAIDKGYLGEATNIGAFSAIGEWQTYTPIFTGFGTVTTIDFKWRKNGSNIDIEGRYTVGTNTGVEARISLPSGLTASSDYTTLQAVGAGWFAITAGTGWPNHGIVTIEPSVTYMTIAAPSVTALAKLTANTLSSTQVHSLRASIRIAGWSASTSAAAADQTNFGWRSTTCTGSWSTNTTYACMERKDGERLYVRGKVSTSGVPTNAALTITVPGSRVIDTTKYPGAPTSNVSRMDDSYAFLVDNSDSNRNHGGAVLYNSTTAVTIRPTRTFNGNLYDVFDTALSNSVPFAWAASDFIEFEFSAPIVGWYENNKAPTLTGSLTSNSLSAYRIETATVKALNGSTCTIASESGDWLGTTTPIAAGRCTIPINTGVFNATPTCTATSFATGYTAVGQMSTAHFSALTNTSMTLEVRYDTGVSNANTGDDAVVSIICLSPR